MDKEKNPVRIEVDLNQIDEIRELDPDWQSFTATDIVRLLIIEKLKALRKEVQS